MPGRLLRHRRAGLVDRRTPPAPEVLTEIGTNLDAFHTKLRAADAWVFAGGLDSPATATVIRAGDSGPLMTDGPYIETKEYLGGLVEDLQLEHYHLWHVTRADLMRRLGRTTEARNSYRRELESTANAVEREFIRKRMDEMWSLGDSNS